jgi:hypothetical protein
MICLIVVYKSELPMFQCVLKEKKEEGFKRPI